MAGMGDMARMMAAGGGGMAGDAGAPDMESQDPNAPEAGPEMGGGDPSEMLNQGISMIESSIDGLPGDLAEKARKHLEGLKEIAAQGQAAGGTPDDQQDPSAQDPSGSDAGMAGAPPDTTGGGQGAGLISG